MVLGLCIAAIIISILVGWRWKLNTGLIALGFAFVIGYFGLELEIRDIIAFWPTTIVFYLISISLFFGYASQNGTMDLLSKKLLYALGGNARLIPFAIILVCAIVGGLGAGASTPVFVGPFVFAMAIEANISPVLAAVCIGFGNLLGSNNPYNGYGGVIGKNLIMENGVEEAEALLMANYTWINSGLIICLLLLFFYFYLKGYRGQKVAVERPPHFSEKQYKSFWILLLVFGFMLIPSLLNAWIKAPMVKALASFCQPQLVMILGSILCAIMKLGDEKKVIRAIPMQTIIMIVGVYTLIKVANQAGLIDFIAGSLSGSVPRALVPGAIVLVAAFLSFFSSSTSTVMPLMYPLVPTLASSLSLNPIALYSCIFFGGLTTAMSPFSTGGALTIGSCPDNAVKEKLADQMIIVSLIIPLITAAAVSLGLFNLFSI